MLPIVFSYLSVPLVTSSNESANEIEQEQNEINTKDNKEISEYVFNVAEIEII